MSDSERIWGEVTDPNNHDPKKFRYLVHALNPVSSVKSALRETSFFNEISDGDESYSGKEYGDQSINLFNQPDRLAERISLSMSLIDENQLGTYGHGGLLVEAPEDNIAITHPSDVGAHNFSSRALLEQATDYNHMSGDELIAASSPELRNEVVSFGERAGKTLKLKGFFIKVDKNGTPVSPVIAQQMKGQATKLNLPLIEVQDRERYHDNAILTVKKNDEALIVQLKGWQFILDGYEQLNFKGRKNYSPDYDYFISPEQMQEIRTFLQERNFDSNRIESIMARYQEAHHEYYKAHCAFDEHGNVTSLSKRHGYGESEEIFSVNQAGYAFKVTSQNKVDQINKILLGGLDSILEKMHMQKAPNPSELDKQAIEIIPGVFGAYEDGVCLPLTRNEVEMLIAEAREGLNTDQQHQLDEWAKLILPDVEEKSINAYAPKSVETPKTHIAPQGDNFTGPRNIQRGARQ